MSTRESYSELKVDKTPLRVTAVTNYDPFEAKFCASLYWLVFRATEDGGLDEIPPQVTSPIERDAENRITVRSEVIELLTNDEIYGKVCNCIFNNKDPVVGHWAVIQCLSRHGFYVVEEGDIAVTDSTLQQRKPFRKSTHMALMDALMAAYSSKVVTIPQVVQAVRKFAPFNASKELPFDLEDSLLLWINKVCSTLNDNEIKKQKLRAEDLLRDQDKAKRFRFRRDQLQPKIQQLFPVIDDLLKGISDGQCLLGLISFYYPGDINIDDIHFGEDISQEKIVGNIELFRSLCSQHICTSALSLQVEDLMYSSQAMKPNLIALLSEIFYKCEVEEDREVKDIKLRSRSCTDYSEKNDAGIKEAVKENSENHRSSSAPMLASEIIATRCPAVGKKLMDFTKEKNKQRSSTSTASEQNNQEQNKTPRRTFDDKTSEKSKSKQNRSYSLQLDFTDDGEEKVEEKGGVDEEDPFNSIMRKPVLASSKYSAPDRVGGSPRIPPKPEPRLNKRAKQKPRTLALEDWEMEEKDTTDIHVADLQRSQSLTGLDKTGMEPRRSFHAWQEGTSSSDTNLDMKRSQRISLDFRPNQHLTSSQAYERVRDKPGLQASIKYNEDRGSQDSVKSTDSLTITNKPSSVPTRKDGYFQGNSQSCTSSMSERELKEFEEMEAMVLAQRSKDFSKNTAAKDRDVSEEDVLNASVSSDDMNRFRLEVLQRLSEDKIRNIDRQGSSEQHQSTMHYGNKRVDNENTRQQSSLDPNGDVSEELLSPINESSEPILSLPDTRASTPSTTPSSPCSPLEVAPFMPAFFMTSPANTIDKKAYKNAVAAKNKQERQERMKEALGAEGIEPSVSQTPRSESLMRSKEDMSPRNKSLEALTRGSYTVDKMSVDAAKAAGIPVIGNERVSELTLNAAYRTTTRSVSVPEPLAENLNTPIHDRVSISSSHLVEQGYDGQIPHQLCNIDSQSKSPIGSHAISHEDPRFQSHEDARQFSPRPSEDVVIFDRNSSELFRGSSAYAQERLTHGSHKAMVPNNVRQSYVDVGYGGSVGLPDNRPMNQHSSYQEQFVAEVSNRLTNQEQLSDEIDSSHVRASQNQDPSRTSFVSNTGTYIRNSPRDSRTSFVSTMNTDPRNSFVTQNMSDRNSFVPTPSESIRNSFVSNPGAADVRNSFIGSQGTDFRHSYASSAGAEASGNSAYIMYSSADQGLESRPIYSDQYGTYIKDTYSHQTPKGYQRDAVHDQRMDNEYSSPGQPHKRHSSPGQFGTFRKHPGPPVIQRQPSPGYHYEQHAPTNHNTTPYHTSQITSTMDIGQQGELQYSSSPRNENEQNYRIPTSQQYPIPGHAQTDPHQHSPVMFLQNGSPTYRTQEYRPRSHQEVVDTYRGSIPETNFSPRVNQIQENTFQTVPQSHRTQTGETARTQSPRAQNGKHQPRDSEIRLGTPDRKSQAFTVDLDTGELKEMSTSSESMSPRSPGSTILRSKTFRKGPEEKVFDYDTKQTKEEQKQGKMSPQTSQNEPAVIGGKENVPYSIGTTNSTSWSQSAEALMSVLHNGFPGENKLKNEDGVLASPRRRTKSGSSDSASPAPRISWLTAGLSGCGGQVMLNEKGEIEETQNKEGEEDTATAKHLTFLRLHFDEKRRQIEAEKRRNHEQWEDERRKLGETLFWYSIGRAQGSNNEPGPVRPGKEGSMRIKEPLRVITHPPRVTDYNGPTSSGQPTPPIGISTPLECMSPVTNHPIQSKPNSGYHSPTVEGYQSPRDPGYYIPPSFGHGYNQASPHRPGCHSPSAASPTYQSPMYSQANYPQPTSSQTGYHPRISTHPGSQSPINSRTGYQSPISAAGFQFPTNNEGRPQSANGTGYHGNMQMQGYQADSTAKPNLPVDQDQEYETREFRLSEYPPQATTPSQQHPQNNGPSKSPSRKCWEVSSPTVPPSVPGLVSQSSVGDSDQDVQPQDDNGIYEDEDPSSKKAFSMFIGDDDPEKMKEEGLTPEQKKKRDRFLRNRQKKMEEEKAKRELENEKKRQREQKQRDIEIQKRLDEDERRSESHQRLKQPSTRQPRENGHKPILGSNQPEEHSTFADFSGPQCYVKPSGKSNRKLIINAISHVCLSGTVNNESKERCLQAIAESQGFNFMVLFKDGLKFRGLYMHNPENEQSYKIYGIGPKVITSKMVECVYKYSSGSKEFIKIPSKTLSISVDGVAINKVYWQSNKPNVASKTQSNLKRPPRPPQR
ncbi:uncharacterized protein LOC116302157 isoform X2 [Actinia tenebrosa]|uniref:Uncharacterized protein LOC116302157 isoform X2 n=1 Tax=Actinia tenebrosa TaxID=6105 RepID=A0A6P8IKB9_ACTTE|nr:uncharacterized protein LOC116302157 isoform X2 [Actinia tenebrosa]